MRMTQEIEYFKEYAVLLHICKSGNIDMQIPGNTRGGIRCLRNGSVSPTESQVNGVTSSQKKLAKKGPVTDCKTHQTNI
jgi:hypothetical protein